LDCTVLLRFSSIQKRMSAFAAGSGVARQALKAAKHWPHTAPPLTVGRMWFSLHGIQQ
jgi:hypothetical protein